MTEPERITGAATVPRTWNTPVRGRAALAGLARCALYEAGFVALLVGALLLWKRGGHGMPLAAALAAVVLTGSGVAVLLALRRWLRRRGWTWRMIGWRRPERNPAHLLWQIPAVIACGAAASAALLLALGETGSDDAVADDLVGGSTAWVVLAVLAMCVLTPVYEELVFRGVVLSALRARWAPGLAIPAAGAIFAAVHLLPPALPYLLVLGIGLAWLAEWYRSALPGMVLHGVNNALVCVAVLSAWGEAR